jgi:hypothetical protein
MDKLLWTQVSNIGPEPRFQQAMSYDVDRDRVVLFSGRIPFTDDNGTPTERYGNDTWEFDGATWAQVADTGPVGRSEFTMCYDVRRRRTVLYGGVSRNYGNLSDTWEWNGDLWTQVAESGPPPYGGPLAYDAAHGYVLMFCYHTANAPKGSTWSWNGSEWTQLDDVGAAGGYGQPAYDGVSKRVIMVCDSAQSASPTFAWTGSSWKQIGELGPKAHSAGCGIAFDGKELLLYMSIAQTWSWNGTAWVERQDMGPPQCLGFSIVGDTKRVRCVLFAGQSIATPETWVLRRVPEDT